MGLLSEVTRGLVRGADRMSAWTSKRGPRTFFKSRGCKVFGSITPSRKFRLIKDQVPVLMVPDLTGFKLKAYVSYRAPAGSEPPLTARALFQRTAAPLIEKDVKEGSFDPDALEKYGFENSQEGKLFKLFPKNFVR
ncbi:large ribosomal subunit protein mL41 [Pantherophis guttatus]|uniref:Large ribosomal subunit protein mL41 n=1 Tax=Pantherophis guttatus TaxID=94885 RepID=A0A6P9AS91_PANGU|nr:large ribosomal subunit protein mL41 [Pantherophis guttatus]